MQAGRELFATQPYSQITGLQICARAGVTRGALQHHFGSKLGLFTAVFDGLQSDVVSRIADALADHDDPWDQARAAIVVLLDVSTDAEYQAVVLKQAPAVIGWRQWRERYRDKFADVVRELIGSFAAAGLIKHSPAMLTATMHGALTELSFEIARSNDPPHTRTAALALLDEMMSKFRELVSNPPQQEPDRNHRHLGGR
ncbi:MAG: TetR/AcrR family transcriptional regulator [Mycolicibacterium sp.]|nr:TetR/AcrR family transcriptional regulator [Mycolicibacterium sp.]